MLTLNAPIRVPPPASAPLEVMFFLSPGTHRVQLLFDPPMEMVTTIRVPMPPSVAAEEPPPPPNSMAITIPGPDKVRPIHPAAELIVERTEWDSGTLSQACARSFPQVARLLVGEGSLTLLVRVEVDGRASQTQIVQSSGDVLRDTTVDACVLSHGEFEPTLVEGQSAASWQRIHWAHRASLAVAR
jgi:hypothetical protein